MASICGSWTNIFCVRINAFTCLNSYTKISHRLNVCTSSVVHAKQQELHIDDEEFRVLVIPGHTKLPETKQEVRREFKPVPPPRYKTMKPEQDWTNVWPTAHSFKWSVVPFPVRQGFIENSENDGIVPGKYANAELMKIPNFLHLTPLHIKKHCAALKQFCNPWPKGLETDEDCKRHFPVEVVTSDYVSDGASIRDVRSRNITVKLKLSDLNLDYHAKDKFLRLVGSKYDPNTDLLTLDVDRCPLKKQNYDYAVYLLTVLYKESLKTEDWESRKTLDDMEKYFWDINASRNVVIRTMRLLKERAEEGAEFVPDCVRSLPGNATDDQIVALPEVQEYKEAAEEIRNEEENLDSVNRYKNSVKQMLLPKTL